MDVPEIWRWVPYGVVPLRKEVLPQRDMPGRGCCEEHEFRKPGPDGPVRRNQQDLFLASLTLHSVCVRRLTGGNAYLRRVKSSHLYLYSAFNNTDCVKALNSIKLEDRVSVMYNNKIKHSIFS